MLKTLMETRLSNDKRVFLLLKNHSAFSILFNIIKMHFSVL